MKNYTKLPVLLFTFLIFKDSFSEWELQGKVKRILLKKLIKLKACIKEKNYSSLDSFKFALFKFAPSKNTFSKIINLIALINSSPDSSEKRKITQIIMNMPSYFFLNISTLF